MLLVEAVVIGQAELVPHTLFFFNVNQILEMQTLALIWATSSTALSS